MRDKLWWLAYLWFTFLMYMDISLTQYALGQGATELNPIMAWIISQGFIWAWIAKTICIGYTYLLLTTRIILCLLVPYVLVIIWSVGNLFLLPG
jgi:hypothetical protein